MRELEITDEMLAVPLVGFTVDYLTAYMLLPDPNERERFIETSTAHFLVGSAGKAPPLRRQLDKGMGSATWSFLANARSPKDWTCDQLDSTGYVAGWVYSRAVYEHHARGEFSLEALKTDALKDCKRGRARGIRIGRARLDEILALHRPCAHLWCAYVCQDLLFDPTFPCPRQPGPLRDFLVRAAWFQEWGLAIRARSQVRTLFDPATLWRVPQQLKLGSPSLTFPDGTVWALPKSTPRLAWSRS